MANQQTSDVSPRERLIAEKMRLMLEFIAKGNQLKTIDGINAHAHQVTGWAQGVATEVLQMLGEQL